MTRGQLNPPAPEKRVTRAETKPVTPPKLRSKSPIKGKKSLGTPDSKHSSTKRITRTARQNKQSLEELPVRQTRSRIRRNFSPESSEANPLTKKAKSHTEVAQTQRKAASKHAKSDQDSMSDDDMGLKNELSK